MNKAKKITLIATASLALAAGGATLWFTRATPEDVLYGAIAKDSPYGHVTVENAVSGEGKMHVDAFAKRDGTYKADGVSFCKTKLPGGYGDVQISTGLRQVQSEMYAVFHNITITNVSEENKEAVQQLNEYLAQNLTGRWIQLTANSPEAHALKEYGLILGTTGITSNKINTTKITDLMKKHGVLTIVNVKDVKSGGKPALQYDLLVRRSAYSKLIDSVQPKFKYKDVILKDLFEEGIIDSTLTIDKASGKIVGGTDSIENPCVGFVSMLSPDAAKDLPKMITAQYSYKSGTDLPTATKPADYLTKEQFRELLGEE